MYSYKNFLNGLYNKRRELSSLLNPTYVQIGEKDIVKIVNSIEMIDLLIQRLIQEIDLHSTKELALDHWYHLRKIQFMWQELIDTWDIKPYKKFPEIPNQEIRPKEAFELSHDFFKSCTDKRTFDIFMQAFNMRDSHILYLNANQSEDSGLSYYLDYCKESYILLYSYYDLQDVILLNHEFGHHIQSYYNYSYNLNNNLLFASEIVSTFFELISIKYYEENGFQQPSIIIAQETMQKNIYMVQNFNDEIKIMKQIGLTKCQKSNVANSKLNNYFKTNGTKKLEPLVQENHFCYLFGYLVAYNLYNIYIVDPEKAFDLLYQLMDIDLKLSPKDYYEEIKKLGLVNRDAILTYKSSLERKLKPIL